MKQRRAKQITMRRPRAQGEWDAELERETLLDDKVQGSWCKFEVAPQLESYPKGQ